MPRRAGWILCVVVVLVAAACTDQRTASSDASSTTATPVTTVAPTVSDAGPGSSTVTTMVEGSVPPSTLAGRALLDELRGHRWVLVSAADTVVPTRVPYLDVGTPEGRLWSGFDGCNWFESDGSLDGIVVRRSGGMGTAVGCAPGAALAPADGAQIGLAVDHRTAFTAWDTTGAVQMLVYRRLDASGDPADVASLAGTTWYSSSGGSLSFAGDGTARIGTCALVWTAESGRLAIAGLDPNAAPGCSPAGADDPGAVDLALAVQQIGPAEARTNGAELFLDGGRIVLRLTRLPEGGVGG